MFSSNLSLLLQSLLVDKSPEENENIYELNLYNILMDLIPDIKRQKHQANFFKESLDSEEKKFKETIKIIKEAFDEQKKQ